MADLLFEFPAPSSADLVFGEALGSTAASLTITGVLPALTALIRLVPPAEIAITGTLPGMTATVSLRFVAPVVITGTLPGMTFAAEAAYFSNTQRPEIYQTRTSAQVANVIEGGISQPEHHAAKSSSGVSAPWKDAQQNGYETGAAYAEASRVAIKTEAPFQQATPVRDAQLRDTMQEGDRQWLRFFSQFQEADRLAASRLDGQFEDGLHDRRPSIVGVFQETTRRAALQYRGTARPAQPVVFGRYSRFQEAWVPRPGQYVPPVIPPEPPEYWGTALLFKCPPATVNLVFGYSCDPPTAVVVVPVQRVYIVINDVSLRRISGNISIPTLSMSMSLDVDSWTWSASAALPGRALDSVTPNSNGDPVEVEVMVNGVPYRFLVESISRDRTFNQSALRVGMRGKTALLDAPYAPVLNFGNTGDRTMAQLVGDVLTLNGVSFDWTYNWLTGDWIVPAGVFQHQGTFISAVTTLANAAGAYVSPHAYNQSLRILPRYPSAPWEWGSVTPDFELPSAVTTQEGIEWVNRPQYNRVFVSGIGQGVLGQVTRTGTAGDMLAPMVTDALITDVVGARMRGLPVLSDTGRIANVSLKLPVLSATGVITPGKMVRYVDGATIRTGIARSVNVSVGATAVDLRQTIAVETHE